jgi:hypothetical protein
MAGWHRFGEGRFWQFKGNELVQGMSGGPVLDLASGGVSAVAAITIAQGADRGGYLAPLEGLRLLPGTTWRQLMHEHDRFHSRDERWTRLRAGLRSLIPMPANPINAEDESELLGLLADLPPPEETALLTLYAGCAADERPAARPLSSLRDVATALTDGAALSGAGPISLLRMVDRLVGSAPGAPVQRALYDWATAMSGRLGLFKDLKTWRSERGTSPPTSGVIVVQVVPAGADAHCYGLTVSVRSDSASTRCLYRDDRPKHTLATVKQLACEQMRIALCWLEGNAVIEFVVPIELFDEPFEALVPTKAHTNAGRKFRFVLRDHDRLHDPTIRYDWQRRWYRLGQPDAAIRWITCDDDLTPEQFSAELEQHPETVIVGLSRRPSCQGQAGRMLRVALDSGVPAALWSRNTCSEHDRGNESAECSGGRFRSTFTDRYSTSPLAELPETIRLLRNKTAGGRSEDDCQGVVLLWDDPEHPGVALAPLTEPPLLPLEKPA